MERFVVEDVGSGGVEDDPFELGGEGRGAEGVAEELAAEGADFEVELVVELHYCEVIVRAGGGSCGGGLGGRTAWVTHSD